MDLDLTPDQELLRDTTRKFLRATVPLTAVRALAENAAGFDRGWWQRGAELGWTSLLVDERRGGGSIRALGCSRRRARPTALHSRDREATPRDAARAGVTRSLRD